MLTPPLQEEQGDQLEEISRGATRRQEAGVRSHKFTEMRTTNKLEKSRQSARECRARKKLRYQVWEGYN